MLCRAACLPPSPPGLQETAVWAVTRDRSLSPTIAEARKQFIPKFLYCSLILLHGPGLCSKAQGICQIHHLLPSETQRSGVGTPQEEQEVGDRGVVVRGRFGFKAHRAPSFITSSIICCPFLSNHVYSFHTPLGMRQAQCPSQTQFTPHPASLLPHFHETCPSRPGVP